MKISIEDESDDTTFMTYRQARDLKLGVGKAGHNLAFYAQYFDLRLLKDEQGDFMFSHDDALLLAELRVDKATIALAKSAGIAISDLIEVDRLYSGHSAAVIRYIKERLEQDPHQLALTGVEQWHQEKLSTTD